MILVTMLQLYSFGTLFAVGLVVGLYYFWKMGRDEHYEEISLFDVYFLGLAGFLVTGRSVYVWEKGLSWWQAISILSLPGINYLAGLVGLAVVTYLVCRAKNWDHYVIFDLLSVAISLSAVFVAIASYDGWIGLIYIFLAVCSFVATFTARKNFRFYLWYKGSNSSAKDGLATVVLLLLLGVSLLMEMIWQGWQLFNLMVGLVVIFLALVILLIRSGRKIKLFSIK